MKHQFNYRRKCRNNRNKKRRQRNNRIGIRGKVTDICQKRVDNTGSSCGVL